MGKRKKRARPPLDDRHRLAIELLTMVPTPNLEDIAKACYVDRRTLYRWRLRKDFDKELRKVSERKSDEYRRMINREFKTRLTNAKDFEQVFQALQLVP